MHTIIILTSCSSLLGGTVAQWLCVILQAGRASTRQKIISKMKGEKKA